MPNENLAPGSSSDFAFHFFSVLSGRRVKTTAGKKVGRVGDLVFALKSPYPEAVGIYVDHGIGRPTELVPWKNVRAIGPKAIEVAPPEGAGAFPPFVDQPGWVLADKHLMGRTILDIDGRTVEAVNDVHLLESHGRMVIVHVDTSFNGFLRRWGLEGLHLAKDRLVSWKYVQPLNVEDAVATDKLSLSLKREQLADLPSEDLADALEELSGPEQQALFSALDAEKAAETLLDAEPRAQRQLVASMREERARAVLSELSVAQLSDLFSVLPHDHVVEMMALLPQENRERVADILGDREVSVGAVMLPDFITMPKDRTVGDAILHIRHSGLEKHAVSYVYVVDEHRRLLGVVDLREIMLAKDASPLSELMVSPVVSVEDTEPREQLRALFGKYHYRMVPVVDAQNVIRGVIRYEDVMKAVQARGRV